MNTTSKIGLLALTTIMVACQNSENPLETVNANGQQLITLKVANVRSRAGRPLTSSEAAQSIENVKVIVTDEDSKVVWTKTLSKWSTTDAEACENGRITTLEIPKDEYRMLVGELYHIYAVGYSNGSDYDLSYFTGLKVDDSFTPNYKIKLTSSGVKAEEIFAGDCTCEGNSEGVRAEVALNRQVAGTFGYLTRIPYVKDAYGTPGRYIILSASNPQSEMVFGQFDNYSGFDGVNYSGRYVVGGTKAAESKIVYTIDLKDWFEEIVEDYEESGRPKGEIKVEGNWKGDATRYRVGSIFGGEFIIPFEKTQQVTFKLYLCTTEQLSSAVREWAVVLPTDASQLSAYDLWSYGTNGWASTNTTDDMYVYNVLRNHLYGIGTKGHEILAGSHPGDPDDPTAPSYPDDEEDDPEPINNKQELPIIVNQSWDTIYNMGVE